MFPSPVVRRAFPAKLISHSKSAIQLACNKFVDSSCRVRRYSRGISVNCKLRVRSEGAVDPRFSATKNEALDGS